MLICRALLLLLLLLPPLVEAATYYVSTSGSAGASCTTAQNINTPRLTINAGLSCLTSGDTLYIRAGTYNETINSNAGNVPNGSSGARTVISGYPGDSAWPVLTGVAGDMMNLVGRAWIEWRRFVLDGNSASDYGISINGSSNQTFADFEIREVLRNAIQFSDSAGISTGNTIQDCHVHDSGLTTNPSFLGHGIYGIMQSSTIQRCRVERVKGWGIHLWNQPANIHNNIIRQNTVIDANQGNVSASGILIGSGNQNIAYSNLVYSTAAGTQMEACFEIGYNAPDNNQLYNNTGYNCARGVSVGDSATNSVVKNNLVANMTTAIVNTSTGAVISDNFCTSAGSGCSVTGAAGFVNVPGGDFHVAAGSLPCGQGVNLSSAGVTADLEGTAYSVPYPQGAYVCTGTTEPPEPNPGTIIAKYDFEEGASTLVGDKATVAAGNPANDGTWTPNAGWTTGMIGTSAGLFDGTRAVQVADITGMTSPDAITLSAWINLSAVSANGCMVATIGDSVNLRIHPDGNVQPSFYTGSTWRFQTSGGVNLISTTARHVLLTYDRVTLRAYVDNANVVTLGATDAISYTLGHDFWIGRHGNGGSDYGCTGVIDQVYVTNGFCNATCVANLFGERVPSVGMSVTHSRFMHANVTEGSMAAGLDSDVSLVLGTPVGWRWALHKGDPGSVTEYFRPQCRIDTGSGYGAWTDVTNAFGSLGVRFLVDSAVSTGQQTGVVLPTDGFTSATGIFLESPIDTTSPYDAAQRLSITAGEHRELEARLETGSPLVATDTVQCRPFREDGNAFTIYDQQLTLTITSVAAPTALRLGGAELGGAWQ